MTASLTSLLSQARALSPAAEAGAATASLAADGSTPDPEEEEHALQGALYVPGVDLSAFTEEERRELLAACRHVWVALGGDQDVDFALQQGSIWVLLRGPRLLDPASTQAWGALVDQLLRLWRVQGGDPRWRHLGETSWHWAVHLPEAVRAGLPPGGGMAPSAPELAPRSVVVEARAPVSLDPGELRQDRAALRRGAVAAPGVAEAGEGVGRAAAAGGGDGGGGGPQPGSGVALSEPELAAHPAAEGARAPAPLGSEELRRSFPWLQFAPLLRGVSVEDELCRRFVSTRRIPRQCVAEVVEVLDGVLAAILDPGFCPSLAAALWALLPRLLLGAVVNPALQGRAARPPRQRDMRAVLQRRFTQFFEGAWLGLLEEGRASTPPRRGDRGEGSGAGAAADPDADEEARAGWARAREMVRFVRMGHLSKAAARLTSQGVAPWTPDIEAQLAALVAPPDAAAPPPAFDWSAARPRALLEPHEFARGLRRAKRGSAPGPTGLRAEHLQTLLSAPHVLDRLRQVGELLANGDVPRLTDHLALSALTPLAKGGGQVRPLAIPDVLRRLIASVLCRQHKEAIRAAAEPEAIAVGVPAATEVAAKSVQVHAARHPNWAYAKNDGTNAYCRMPRAPALRAVEEATPELARFTASWYARTSRYVVYRPDGTSTLIRSTAGWDQGDPLAPAGYTLGSSPALRRAKQRIQLLVWAREGEAAAADVLLLAYLDDVLLGVPADCFADALRTLQEELATVGHIPNPRKLEIWTPSGVQPPGLPAAAQAQWRADGLTVLGLPLPAPAPAEENRELGASGEEHGEGARGGGNERGTPRVAARGDHGGPHVDSGDAAAGRTRGGAERRGADRINEAAPDWSEWEDAAVAALAPGEVAGSDEFVEAYMRARVEAAGRLADRVLRTLEEGEAGSPTAQAVGLLLRLCVQPRVMHLLRGHYARSITALADVFDAKMRKVAAKLWRTPPGWPRRVELQMRLPLRMGGMGFRPMRAIAPAAFLGSWAQVLPAVQRLVGGRPLLGAGADPSPLAAAVSAAEEDWRRLAGEPDREPVDWGRAASSENGIPRLQRVLSQTLDRARLRELMTLADPADRTRIRNCAGTWAGVWLTVTPTEHGLSFLDGEYAALVRFRLRVPLLSSGGPCRRQCGGGRRARGWFDPEGDHAHSCGRGGGAWGRRHRHLQHQLTLQLRWLGFWAEMEQEEVRLPHRPDVRTEGLTLPRAHLEVHVSHPARHVTEGVQRRRGASTDAFVEEAWQRRLRDDYGGGAPADAPFDLVPAVVNSYGGWHPHFARWWRGAVRAAAERAGPTASQVAMLWRTVGFLSVTLQRQNFQVLAGCAPGLEEQVLGRLGRPLSEAPEFWRAAPEEALDWGTEEFDYPRVRESPPNEAEELGWSAEGHLHAAGLRL